MTPPQQTQQTQPILSSPHPQRVREFLKQSNQIEDVFDEQSLADAQIAWDFAMEHSVMTVPTIMEIHKRLMKNQPLEEKYKGAWRDCTVYVGGKMALPHKLVPMALLNWTLTVQQNLEGMNTRERHIVFEKIHPFVDGNGRVGRILLNWVALKKTEEPFMILNSEFREAYYDWFR
jgi:Fic family protein